MRVAESYSLLLRVPSDDLVETSLPSVDLPFTFSILQFFCQNDGAKFIGV